ncbi:hypothetical protein EDC04DRAFT_2681577 [Pisolithus marmoratus]|nr:hypothetical protein EDC04DRAFT_2681577 [Pisolithus marmoratus]
MMVTAGAELAFWLPGQSGENEETAKELLQKIFRSASLRSLQLLWNFEIRCLYYAILNYIRTTM